MKSGPRCLTQVVVHWRRTEPAGRVLSIVADIWEHSLGNKQQNEVRIIFVGRISWEPSEPTPPPPACLFCESVRGQRAHTPWAPVPVLDTLTVMFFPNIQWEFSLKLLMSESLTVPVNYTLTAPVVCNFSQRGVHVVESFPK